MSVQDTNTFRSYIDERIAIEFVCKAFYSMRLLNDCEVGMLLFSRMSIAYSIRADRTFNVQLE